MGNRRLHEQLRWQRSLKRCSKFAANRQTDRVCPTLYPPNLSFFLIWLFENGTSQTQNRLKAWFCLIKKSLLPLSSGSRLCAYASGSIALFSRYYSVSNAIFKPTCIAIQVALPVLQYTSFLVDDCFSIRPGNSCLFPAALAVQREKYQRRIPVDLRARVCSAGRTLYPLGIPLFFFHHGTFLNSKYSLCGITHHPR